MRRSLKPLVGRRARFAANFGQVSKGGNILLHDLRGPKGEEAHIWVPSYRWPGKIRLPETEIHFSARVGAYDRPDGTYDYGLIDIEIEPEA